MISVRNRIAAGVLAIGIAFLTSPLAPMVFAQDAVVAVPAASTVDTSQPAPKETVVVNQDVSIPYGQWVEDLGDIAKSWLIPTLLGVVTWVVGQYVPGPLRGIATRIATEQGQQLLQRALDYGINATAGARHDATLEVPVANNVLRAGLNYALAHGEPKVIDFLDGSDGILQKLFARLDIPVEATTTSVGIAPAVPSQAKLNKSATTKGKPVPHVLSK